MLESNITASGNDVFIEIPITYTGEGATPDVISKFNQGIEKNWSGKFGKYNVVTKVTKGSDNIIDVPIGNDRAYVKGTNRGVWPSQRPGWTAAHEAGHLMGLPDKYDYVTGKPLSNAHGNIMAEHGGVAWEQDIRIIQMEKSNRVVVGKEPRGGKC